MPRRRNDSAKSGKPTSSRARKAGEPLADTPSVIQPLPRRVVAAVSISVSVLTFIVYHATLIPTVVDQDSGELVAAVHVLGVAHPTGYPLWVLLGRLFDFLPVGGTSAYRVALLSAVCAAAAAGIVTALAAALVRQLIPAMVAGLGFGLWFPTWSQAVRAEVYGLTALLTALALVALVRWERERSWRWVWWLVLGVGFVAMHHRTAMLMLAPALVMAVVATKPRRFKSYLATAGLFLAPFAFYVYLPLRAMARPALNWTDPSTLQRFRDHVLATQYTHFAFSHDLAQMLEQAGKLTPEMLAASPVLAVLLALVGLPLIAFGSVEWLRKQPAVAWSLAGGLALLCIWVLQWGETSDLKVFFLPLGEVLAVCGAIGLGKVSERLPTRVATGVMATVGVFICAALLGANWGRSDASNVWEHRDRWVAALTQMEPNAIFVSDFDVPSFATLYLQNVEGLRRDVTLLRTVRMSDQWYVDLIEDDELRKTAQEAWADSASLGERPLEIHDQTAVFAYRLARALEGKRPVYCLHGPFIVRLTGPSYFVAWSEDLVALNLALPKMKAGEETGPVLTEFPGGAKLVGFRWDKVEARTGELVGFTTTWRVEGTAPLMQFGVGLRPETMPAAQFERKLMKKGRFVQGYPLLYGPGVATELSPGVYQQRGQAIMPSNAPTGEYQVAVGIGPMYTPVYQQWTEVAKIRIIEGPLPNNGP